MEERREDKLTWRMCPATLHPWKGVCAWLVIIGISVALLATDLISGIVAPIFMVAAMASFLFPSTYKLDGDGLHAHQLIRKKFYAWKQIRRVKFLDEVCYLFKRKNPSITEGGMMVFYGTRKDEISSAIKSHLHEGVAT